ncbi:MAG: fibronectin type III domain-containing protein [Candidatus Magasanikbacteria bacterium]|nr:fibronectin type III domain-containing protein [Candidatus Magasanikbacteria bacterium]
MRLLSKIGFFLGVVLAAFCTPSFVRAADPASGTFVSQIIDFGGEMVFGEITWNDTVPGGTSIVMEVRAGNSADVSDGVWTTVVKNEELGENFDGRRYAQYRITFETEDGDFVPSVEDVSIEYVEAGTFSLIGSPYDAGDLSNVLAGVSWVATTPTGTSVRFQMRTSPDNNSWTSWMGPDGTNGTYFTASDGSQSMPAVLGDGEDDRWVQYQTFLTSEDAVTVPVLSSATVTYVVNAPPEISVTSTPIFQSSSGLVEVTYEVRDFDTLTGSTPGTVAIDLQYCTSNCSSIGNEVWQTAASSSLTGSYGAGIVVDAEDYTEYSLIWDPTISLASHYNGSDFKIRIRANDAEAANNYAYDESNTFTLDTADPVVSSFVIDARSNANPSLTLSVTDDTLAGLLMKLSNNSDLSPDGLNDDSGTWIPYTATSSWVFASGPTSTVYYSISDAYGNLSSGDAVSSALSPLTPVNIVIRDISNSEMSEWWEFIAWGVVPEPVAGFKQYTIYRSTDGSNYSVLATQTDRTINYYLDDTLDTETTYYYKVVAEDDDDNISKYSSVVSDAPNGQGGSDSTGPTISLVSSTAIGTESVTITWDTDELSDSTVDYMTNTGGDFSLADSIGLTAMVDSSAGLGQHTVTISGLTPATTYYYRVRSQDPQSNEGVSTENPDGYSFTTLSGPVITDVAISHISNTEATITWATDQSSDSYIYYSTSTILASPTLVGLANSVQDHEVTLGSLSPGITYYFFVQSGVGQDKNVVDGEIQYYTFTTTMDVAVPIITFDAGDDVSVTEDSVTISWTTDEIATSTIEYGTSDSYGTSVINNNYNTDHFSVISGLLGGTLYHFRLYATDENGNRSVATEFVATTTDSADNTPPVISDVEATVVTDDEALIVWDTDEAATGRVYFGTATTLYTASSTLVSTYNRAHAITLSSLTTSTLYYYVVVSLDSSGNSTTSSEYTFTTLETLSEESEVALREETARAEGVVQGSSSGGSRGGGGGTSVDRTAPIISAASVAEISGSRASVSWTANEASVGIMEFGTAPDVYTKSAVTMPLTFKTDHRIALQDLDPLTTYYYRVSAADASFNVSNVLTGSFTTLSELEDLDELVSSTENILIGEETEEVFISSIEKASELIRSLSTRVGVGALEATLTDQAAFIQELSALLPLPIIGGQPLVEVGSNYAQVSWTTDKYSNSLVKFAPEDVFETLGQEYDQTVGDAATMVLNHRVEIKNLQPNTLYHYRVISRTIAGAETVSADFTFRTAAEVTEINTYKFDVISANEARIMWVTSAPTDSSVAFTPYRGGVPDLDSKQFVKDASFVTQHSLTLSELEAGVVYDIELSGVDYGGNTVRELIQGFSTTDTDLAPIISQIQTDSAIIPGSTEKIQTIISWNTNELSTSRVYYRKGFATNETPFTEMTTLDLGYVKKHIVVVSNFESGQVYQFAVESTDSSGNTALSNTITILTPRKEESVFQVIMSNFEDLFSWVGRVRR